MNSDGLARALAAIDDAHRADPKRERGEPEELRYAEAVTRWIAKLVAAPTDALVLAARAQHLERWVIPRADFPEGRAGYFKWRLAIQARQGARARQLLTAAGCDAALAGRVSALVAKGTPKDDAEAQALEDAACLVFLESELETFARAHRDYPQEKLVDIIRKTWRKMSPQGRALARAIPLPAELAQIVASAID